MRGGNGRNDNNCYFIMKSALIKKEKGIMAISLIFRIAAVGILITILNQILKHSGREDHAFLLSLAGLLLVLTWILPAIYDLFMMIQSLFEL